MANSIDDYRLALDEMRGKLHDVLAGGTAHAPEIAGYRFAVDLMEEDLRLRPADIVNKFEFRSRQEPGTRGPLLWQRDAIERSKKMMTPYEPSEAEYLRKNTEYFEAIKTKLGLLNVKTHTTGACDKQYFMEENPEVEKVKKELIEAIRTWMNAHKYEPNFYKMSAVEGIAAVLQERQDIVFSLRAAQDLGAGKVTAFDRDVSFLGEALAFGIGCLPIVGNAMALLEAYEGRDLFCRELSPTERALAIFSVLLPGLLRLIKVGRAAYSATRLAQLYGRDAAKWSYMIQMGERAAIQPAARITVQEAGSAVRAGKRLSPQAVKDAEESLGKLMGKSVGGASAAPVLSINQTRKMLLEALEKLGNTTPSLKELDVNALARVSEAAFTKKGISMDRAKGQLLEELKESRTVKLLREQFSAKALGLDADKFKLEYFPGHMLTDSRNRKITDGIIARRLVGSEIQQVWYGARTHQEIKRIQGVLEVWAIDEAKAGKASSQGLSYKYNVTEEDLAALKEVAMKRFENRKLKAAKEGKPFTATLEEIEKGIAKEYKLGEIGGQARSTIERLDSMEDGSLPRIFVGGDEYLVRIRSISKTKIFGVLPKDVPSKGIVKRLRSPLTKGGEGLDFEVIGINITQKDLEELTKKVLQVSGGIK
ncbi:hypothetical protein G5B47_17475 [Paenibacillus sp. 7124]|uniref:Pre-toxin TG domain-containing protein n=1 Tax=Paenibacillus apii TaxID=1850370 RepID=A0A6M1PM07_9BACL|nr:pre-toxin TG domain-containing protein [Paenibacillus apii]NGM84206.1 hypothetical protein [Paenibacillus apii]